MEIAKGNLEGLKVLSGFGDSDFQLFVDRAFRNLAPKSDKVDAKDDKMPSAFVVDSFSSAAGCNASR